MQIIGVDEAGRGPLAGRVYAAAVILDPFKDIKGLRDSKALSPLARDRLFDEIKCDCLSYSISFSTHDEIDKINILQATFLAMERAVKSISSDFDHILVDGNQFPFSPHYSGNAVVKGDTKIPEIMAASILAKVSRDRYMEEMHILYPEYQFIKHKGYPTQLHRDLVKEFGPSPIHRKTFKGVKEYLNLIT